jgi:hypothetical protein
MELAEGINEPDTAIAVVEDSTTTLADKFVKTLNALNATNEFVTITALVSLNAML